MSGPGALFSPAVLLDALQRIFAQCPHKPRGLHVGLSGGADSSALLAALSGLGQQLDTTIGAIHVNHGSHVLAGDWEHHCRQLCAQLAVPLQVLRLEPDPHSGRGPEGEWRHQRYQALAALLTEGDCLLTAHHREDQAETLLLQLMRGSGLAGLAGMPRWRPLGRALLARPLLDTPKAVLEAYLRERGISWVEDPSNADPGMDRTFLRHRVLPLFEQRWPAAQEMLARSAGHAREALELNEQWVNELVEAALGPCSELQLGHLPARHTEVIKAAVRGWLKRQGAVALPMARLEELCRQLQHAQPGSAVEVRWATHVLRLYRDSLWLLPEAPPQPVSPQPWRSGARLQLGADAGWLSLDHAVPAPGWQVRCRTGGEQLAGAAHHVELKDWLRRTGLPPWLRDSVPLLVSGDTVLAIGDCLLSADLQAWLEQQQADLCWAPANPLLAYWRESIQTHRKAVESPLTLG